MLETITDKIKTCGCVQNTFLNLEGKRFGRLVGVEFVDFNKARQAIWKFQCDCGVSKVMESGKVTRKKDGIVSCGCLLEESVKRAKTHGLCVGGKHPLHHVWRGMKDRCYKPSCESYYRYGGRGIIIEEPWLSDYSSFHTWSLANGWAPGLQIDRRDNDGPYAPWNCRYVTPEINSNNTSKSKKGLVFGVEFTPALAGRHFGINNSSLCWLMNKRNHTLQEAVIHLLQRKTQKWIVSGKPEKDLGHV